MDFSTFALINPITACPRRIYVALQCALVAWQYVTACLTMRLCCLLIYFCCFAVRFCLIGSALWLCRLNSPQQPTNLRKKVGCRSEFCFFSQLFKFYVVFSLYVWQVLQIFCNYFPKSLAVLRFLQSAANSASHTAITHYNRTLYIASHNIAFHIYGLLLILS